MLVLRLKQQSSVVEGGCFWAAWLPYFWKQSKWLSDIAEICSWGSYLCTQIALAYRNLTAPVDMTCPKHAFLVRLWYEPREKWGANPVRCKCRMGTLCDESEVSWRCSGTNLGLNGFVQRRNHALRPHKMVAGKGVGKLLAALVYFSAWQPLIRTLERGCETLAAELLFQWVALQIVCMERSLNSHGSPQGQNDPKCTTNKSQSKRPGGSSQVTCLALCRYSLSSSWTYVAKTLKNRLLATLAVKRLVRGLVGRDMDSGIIKTQLPEEVFL